MHFIDDYNQRHIINLGKILFSFKVKESNNKISNIIVKP